MDSQANYEWTGQVIHIIRRYARQAWRRNYHHVMYDAEDVQQDFSIKIMKLETNFKAQGKSFEEFKKTATYFLKRYNLNCYNSKRTWMVDTHSSPLPEGFSSLRTSTNITGYDHMQAQEMWDIIYRTIINKPRGNPKKLTPIKKIGLLFEDFSVLENYSSAKTLRYDMLKKVKKIIGKQDAQVI